VPQNYQITFMSENEWKLPFNIAIGFHLLFFLGIFYLPGLFNTKPKFADIYTVSLVTVAEPVSQPEQVVEESVVDPVPIKVPPVLKVKKIAPIVEPVKKAVVPPQKAISIKPLKKKKIKKNPQKRENSRLKELARKRRERLAEALKDEEKAAKDAQEALKELERERELIKTAAAVKSPSKPTSSKRKNSTTGISGSLNLIEGQYHAAIFGRLHQFWSLPEYMQKNKDLTAVVVITINKNGQIADMFFEHKSGDKIFDQFVKKTIEAANPLPPIPAIMKKQRYEIGLRFKPGSIH